MRKSRFTEPQIVSILKEAEGRQLPVQELCRKHGITEQTYYRWKSKYGGLEVQHLHELKALQTENAELKKLVGEMTLENRAIKAVLEKKF